jgi:arsenite methyltransferase
LETSKLRAKMFNRKASNPENKPNEILATLALQSGQNIADIGAGGGYFSLRFAEAVKPGGKVYAVDTNEQFLDFLSSMSYERGLSNLQPILAAEGHLQLPERALDVVFMRNVYHHLSNRVQYFKAVVPLLKAHGRVAIVEYRRSSRFSFRGMFKHYVPEDRIVHEMEDAGYRLERAFTFLPEQSFTIFSVRA